MTRASQEGEEPAQASGTGPRGACSGKARGVSKAAQPEQVMEEMSGRNAGQRGCGTPAGHEAGLGKDSKCVGSQGRLEGRAGECSDVEDVTCRLCCDSGGWGRSRRSNGRHG